MENYLKEALEIVKAQASVRTMNEEEITTMIRKLSEGIKSINEGELALALNKTITIEPQKSIKEKSISCVVCGKVFKLLTKKHLSTHDMTPESYREFCGYKKNTPLVCKSLQRDRRKKMKDMRLWERRT